MDDNRIWLFDTTLRDGGQTRGVDFSQADKIAIAAALDEIGVDYIEGGWPGANPTDDAFFASPPQTRNARMVACLLYTSPSPRDRTRSRMPSSA